MAEQPKCPHENLCRLYWTGPFRFVGPCPNTRCTFRPSASSESLGCNTWDDYAKLILRLCNWSDEDMEKVQDLKDIMAECYDRTLDRKCHP